MNIKEKMRTLKDVKNSFIYLIKLPEVANRSKKIFKAIVENFSELNILTFRLKEIPWYKGTK